MGSAKKRRWSYSAGERGRNRVRAYEDNRSGVLILEFWEREPGQPEAKRKRVSLRHRDRERAKRQADEMAARLAKGQRRGGPELMLQRLFDIYGSEVTPEKGVRQQEHDRMSSEMFLRFFGPDRKANTFSRRDWDRFIRERRSGKIRPAQKAKAEKVGERTIERDLKWLLAVLNWATLAGDGRGGFLLEWNPLRGLPLPKEKNSKRPIVSEERYKAMLDVAPKVDSRFALVLILAHETGHRLSAVLQLRWSDVDLTRSVVRWQAATDKSGREHETPLTACAVAALQGVQREHPAIGDAWVLPAPRDPSRPMSRYLAQSCWRRAERLAKLEHVEGLGWHGLRRKFATERKDASRVDLCALGGWKTPRTLEECYQRPDRATMKRVLEEREPLFEAAGD